jgi:hypothetical protein
MFLFDSIYAKDAIVWSCVMMSLCYFKNKEKQYVYVRSSFVFSIAKLAEFLLHILVFRHILVRANARHIKWICLCQWRKLQSTSIFHFGKRQTFFDEWNSPVIESSAYQNEAITMQDEVFPELNWISTTPWRRMGDWMYRSTFSSPRH